MRHAVSGRCGLQCVEEFDGPVGAGSGLEDGLFVAAHDLEPVLEVLGVVVAQVRRHAQVRAKKSGAQLRDLS